MKYSDNEELVYASWYNIGTLKSFFVIFLHVGELQANVCAWIDQYPKGKEIRLNIIL